MNHIVKCTWLFPILSFNICAYKLIVALFWEMANVKIFNLVMLIFQGQNKLVKINSFNTPCVKFLDLLRSFQVSDQIKPTTEFLHFFCFFSPLWGGGGAR